MTAWLATTLLLVLTFAAFAAALWLYRLNRGRPTLQALMHPLVTGPLIVSVILVATHIDYDQYREANQLFFFLLKLLVCCTIQHRQETFVALCCDNNRL